MLFRGKAPGVGEIHPEMLKALGVVGLSWLTIFFNVSWRSGIVPIDSCLVPVCQKGDQRVCSNYQGSHYSAPWEKLMPEGWKGGF